MTTKCKDSGNFVLENNIIKGSTRRKKDIPVDVRILIVGDRMFYDNIY